MVDVTSNVEDNPEHLKRPKSDELVDIHVYLLPSERWIEQRRLAKNIAMDYSVSAGFVRVHPSHSLRELRSYIVDQLESAVPENFVFLRSVGRNLTQVKPRQENDLRVKSFMPPQAEDPEVYLKEGTYAELGGEDSGVEESSVDDRRASLSRKRQPSTRTSGIPLHNGMHRKRKEPISTNASQRKINDGRKGRTRRGSVAKPAENAQRRKSIKAEQPKKVEAKEEVENGGASPEPSEAEERPIDEGEFRLQDDGELTEKVGVEDLGIGEEHENEDVSQTEGYPEELSVLEGEEGFEYIGQADEDVDGEKARLGEVEETTEGNETEDIDKAAEFVEYAEQNGETEEINIEEQQQENYDYEGMVNNVEGVGIEEITGEDLETLEQHAAEEATGEDLETLEQHTTEETENAAEGEEHTETNGVDRENNKHPTELEDTQLENQDEKTKEGVETNNDNTEQRENGIDETTEVKESEQNENQVKENENGEETKEEETELTDEEKRQLEVKRRKEKREQMLKMLERVRMERKYYELQRTELLKRAKEMKRLKLLKFEEAREIWMKRYQQVKKTTPKLEDECAQLRKELEQLVRDMLNQLYYEEKTAAGKNEPCKKTTYKLTVLKVLQEIEDLRQRVQSTKIKLKAEIELRKQAESDVKRLREELLKKKIQVSLTRDNKTGVKPAKTLQRQTIGAL